MAIDYDKTAAEYEASLVTKLRGHGAGSFLEHWVPDPDPALGIFNMIEAAWIGGRNDIELVVARATLSEAALQKLKDVAAPVAELEIDESPVLYSLKVKRVARINGAKQQARVAVGGKVEVPRTPSQAPSRDVDWDLHPALAAALESEAASISCEGVVSRDKDCVTAQSASERGTVSIAVAQTGLIRAARFSNVRHPLQRKVLELMCRLIEGRTVQDASDHAATYVVHQLERRAGKRPTEGILLPANAGLQVLNALGLVRGACHEYLAKWGHGNTENFFELPPAPAWGALDGEERLCRAIEAATAFSREEGIPGDAMKVVRVEKDIHGQEIRVIVQVGGRIAHEGVPLMLRRLERHLKAKVEPVLQVYLEPLKDLSVLRRL